MDLVAGRALAQERRPIRHLDPVLLLTAIALIGVGLLLIYSATHQTLEADGLDPYARVKKQLVSAAIGAVLVVVISSIDYRFFKVYAGFIFGASLVLLGLLQIPGVASSSGPGATIDLPGADLLQINPPEFAKIGLIVILAASLSELRSTPDVRDVVRLVLVAATAMLLVFINIEIGSVIVLVAITVGELVVAGTRPRHLAVLAATALVALLLAFQTGAIRDYQFDRIRAFLDPQNAPESVRYNLDQSLIAIGSGGLTGRGYLTGTQTNLDYVPEQHTDFIFTVVGEEFGFVGAVVVLALFGVLLFRAFRIAYLSRDPFGSYLAAGVASMFAIQVFVNVGMTIGIMPITGIPLPFLSFGGSAMLVNCIAVGLLLNVHMRRFT
ncbi:MAG: rod shape-determining protein RodA [Actinomycetota bacterium]|jgi:rod shape determining protein RodA|nr:MAG: rod shape-determining protein RodA [Actinomycetota bacterium]